MKVFLSWSKSLSRDVASALHWWLPQVLQSVQPFMSSSDIEAGRRWSATIAGELQDSNFGILCVTRENRHEPWLNFEAGALAKNLDEAYVVPLLIDLSPADLEGPLAQFQAITTLDRAGVERILSTIDGLNESGLGEERLRDAVDVWWPALERKLEAARRPAASAGPSAPLRDQRELLEEMLGIVRKLSDAQDRMATRVSAIELAQPLARLRPPSDDAGKRRKLIEIAEAIGVEGLGSVASTGSTVTFTYTEPPSTSERVTLDNAALDFGFTQTAHAMDPSSPWSRVSKS